MWKNCNEIGVNAFTWKISMNRMLLCTENN